MVEKTVKICDVCSKSIAKSKCSFCEKDVCLDCIEEIEAGTVKFKTCPECCEKIENAGRNKGLWKEFNKNEDMASKIRTYLKKKMILKALDSDEDEGGDGGYTMGYPSPKNIRRTIKKGKGDWAKTMGDTTI